MNSYEGLNVPDGEWVEYILYYKKKRGPRGGKYESFAFASAATLMQQSSDACQAEYESFAFGFSANTAEISNANRSHLHDTAITRLSDTNRSHLHLI